MQCGSWRLRARACVWAWQVPWLRRYVVHTCLKSSALLWQSHLVVSWPTCQWCTGAFQSVLVGTHRHEITSDTRSVLQ